MFSSPLLFLDHLFIQHLTSPLPLFRKQATEKKPEYNKTNKKVKKCIHE